MDWYYAREGAQYGPLVESELKALLRSGTVLPTDLVWCEEMEDWLPAGNVPELWQQPVEGHIPLERAQPALSGMAIGSLILAIIALPLAIMCVCVSPALALAAIVLGHMARAQIRREPHLYSGSGVALAGLILGYLSLVVAIAFTVVMAMMWDPEVMESSFEQLDTL